MTKHLFTLTLLFILGISYSSAMNFTSGRFHFKTESTPQQCMVTGVAAFLSGDIEIPSTVLFYDEDGNQVNYTVIGIDSGALQDQSEVSSFILPSTITYIGNDAFSGCSMLETIDFPDAVVSIGDMVIDNCPNIKNIILGSKLKTIGYMAFAGASNLKKVTIRATIPPSLNDEDTFNWQVLHTMILEVPTGCVEAYRKARYWSDITNIVENKSSSINNINDDAAHTIYAINGDEIEILTDENISIVSIDGKVIASGTNMAGSKMPLKKNVVYILNCSGQSFKLIL